MCSENIFGMFYEREVKMGAEKRQKTISIYRKKT
jgi:hypothetical protein